MAASLLALAKWKYYIKSNNYTNASKAVQINLNVLQGLLIKQEDLSLLEVSIHTYQGLFLGS